MEIIHLESIQQMERELSVALGFFDGIHLGHQKLITRAVERAREAGIASALFTFRRHPLEVIHHGLCFPYLSSMDEKLCVARSLGLDYFIDVDFTEDFSHMKPENFVEDILMEKLKGKILIVGNDYRFGYRASGNVYKLRQLARAFDSEVVALEDVKVDGLRISSTGIREAIMGGNLEYAARCLGRWYSIRGTVKSGSQRGRRMGFPTANVDLPSHRVMPRPGVYGVFVRHKNQIHPGAGHVGDRPTFNEPTYNLEVNLFDFDGDLYGVKLDTYLVRHVRDTREFDDPIQMARHISEDISRCRKLLSEIDYSLVLKYIPCADKMEVILNGQ